MEEREGFVEFIGDADRFYRNLSSMDDVAGLWEQILQITDHNEVDNEVIFELPSEDDLLKIIYGPPFTIAFRNRPGGRLFIYTILPPRF